MGETMTYSPVYALLLMLLVHIAGFVAAVDIIYYDNASECVGNGWACPDIDPLLCCAPDNFGRSMIVVGAYDTMQIHTYTDGGCSNLAHSFRGDRCLIHEFFTGAFWFTAVRRSLLAGNSESYETPKTCVTQTNATAIVYSQDSRKGYWVLKTDDFTEMYAQMVKIPDVQKVDWLQAQGAAFRDTS